MATRANNPARHTGNLPNEARRQRVIQLYETGLSMRDVAREVNVTFQAVHSMLVRAGVYRRPRGGNTGPHSRHRK